ncbi:hypothetical protein [Mycobacterium sp. OTB74]|uniref:hypothetical protein n=1 Tax=Mycobacterium sp. OTB74 TaxID=1853452 RepID=UPI002474B4BA|nr:hypothetical protein [Mycobacterium sp. OTB74]MDH6245482.1 hypothetical protein [Mycobacterium sp. OTB74]
MNPAHVLTQHAAHHRCPAQNVPPRLRIDNSAQRGIGEKTPGNPSRHFGSGARNFAAISPPARVPATRAGISSITGVDLSGMPLNRTAAVGPLAHDRLQ